MKCTGKLSDGRPCPNNAIRGGTVCHQRHGGSAPQVQLAAKRRLVEQEALAIVKSEYGTDFPELEDPTGELLSLMSELLAVKSVLADRAAQLETVAVENKHGDQMIAATLAAYLQMLEKCGDLLVKINRLGLGDHGRTVREEDAQNVGLALRKVLADPRWELDHETQREILSATAEEIRRIYS